MFEKASRQKLRFNYKGLCSVEDLWDLPLEALDKIYADLNSKLKEKKEASLLRKKSQEDEVLALKMNLVKYIVETRLEEQRQKEDEAARAAKKQKVLSIIAEKQDEDLRNRPIEELEKLVNDL